MRFFKAILRNRNLSEPPQAPVEVPQVEVFPKEMLDSRDIALEAMRTDPYFRRKVIDAKKDETFTIQKTFTLTIQAEALQGLLEGL